MTRKNYMDTHNVDDLRPGDEIVFDWNGMRSGLVTLEGPGRRDRYSSKVVASTDSSKPDYKWTIVDYHGELNYAISVLEHHPAPEPLKKIEVTLPEIPIYGRFTFYPLYAAAPVGVSKQHGGYIRVTGHDFTEATAREIALSILALVEEE